MVYLFGDWGMGDTKYTTCKNVSKLSSTTDEEENNKLTSKTITGLPSDKRQVASSTTTSLISVSSSSSSSLSSLTSLALNKPSVTSNIIDKTIKKQSQQQQQNQLLPISTKDQQQILTINHATELIRQRSWSLQHDDRHKLCQQQSEHDDEVAVHPLTNQVTIFWFLFFFFLFL